MRKEPQTWSQNLKFKIAADHSYAPAARLSRLILSINLGISVMNAQDTLIAFRVNYKGIWHIIYIMVNNELYHSLKFTLVLSF